MCWIQLLKGGTLSKELFSLEKNRSSSVFFLLVFVFTFSLIGLLVAFDTVYITAGIFLLISIYGISNTLKDFKIFENKLVFDYLFWGKKELMAEDILYYTWQYDLIIGYTVCIFKKRSFIDKAYILPPLDKEQFKQIKSALKNLNDGKIEDVYFIYLIPRIFKRFYLWIFKK